MKSLATRDSPVAGAATAPRAGIWLPPSASAGDGAQCGRFWVGVTPKLAVFGLISSQTRRTLGNKMPIYGVAWQVAFQTAIRWRHRLPSPARPSLMLMAMAVVPALAI